MLLCFALTTLALLGGLALCVVLDRGSPHSWQSSCRQRWLLIGTAALCATACSTDPNAETTTVDANTDSDGSGESLDGSSDTSGDDGDSLESVLCAWDDDPLDVAISQDFGGSRTCIPEAPTSWDEEGIRITMTPLDCPDDDGQTESGLITVRGPRVDFGLEPVEVEHVAYVAPDGRTDSFSLVSRGSQILAMTTNETEEWQLIDAAVVDSSSGECCLLGSRWVVPFELEGTGPDGEQVRSQMGSVITIVDDGHELLARMFAHKECPGSDISRSFEIRALASDVVVR